MVVVLAAGSLAGVVGVEAAGAGVIRLYGGRGSSSSGVDEDGLRVVIMVAVVDWDDIPVPVAEERGRFLVLVRRPTGRRVVFGCRGGFMMMMM